MESSVQCCKLILLGKVAVAREMKGLVCLVLDTQSLHFRKNGLPSGLTSSVECGSHNNCGGTEEMEIKCYDSLNENGHYLIGMGTTGTCGLDEVGVALLGKCVTGWGMEL